MLSISQIKEISKIETIAFGGYTAGIFGRTIDKLQKEETFFSVMSHVNTRNLAKYKSLIDYIFCETWFIPWKRYCGDFYAGKRALLMLDAEFSKAEMLWHDIAMSRLIIPICEEAESKQKSYKWRRVVNNMRACLIGHEATVRSKPDFSQVRSLQRVLDKQYAGCNFH